MRDVALHFAFPSGVLTYACPSCDQRCCKTGALALLPEERQRVVQRYPALELVAPLSTDEVASVATPCSGCWFLAGQRCTLVGADGGALRPRACSLYPWNLFGLHGTTLVVAPHPLCPLGVVRQGGTTHAEVLELLAGLGAAGAPPEVLRRGDPPEALALERLLREAAGAAIAEGRNPVQLLAFSELATGAFLGGGTEALGHLAAADVARHEADVTARLGAMAVALGVDMPAVGTLARLGPTFAAWAPILRLFALEEVPLARLPSVLLALLLYAAEWQAGRPERPVLPQTLTQLIGALRPRLELLAAWDSPWRGAAVPELDVSPGDLPSRVALPRLSREPLARQAQLQRLAAAYRSA